MSTTDTTGPSRRLVLSLAVAVALLCTGVAYEGMYQFGRDMLGWGVVVAVASAGIFELAQLAVALLAREAIKAGRPAGTLLTITWMLAGASGLLAAWHELAAGHGIGAALFRIFAPVLAAGLWHLVLLGDRHLAAGRTWSQMRADARMHALFLTVEDAARAHDSGRGIARAEAKRRRARAVALRTVPPEDMRAKAAAHLDALAALADATTDVARMHLETNARVSGLGVPVLSGADYTDRAADAVTAELADMAALSATPAAGQDTPRVRATVRPKARRTVRPASTGDRAARLAIVSDLLSENPAATTRDAMSALADAGHVVVDRTARRLLSEVRGTDTTPDTDADTVADHAPDTAALLATVEV